jgi:hypothetical protein
MHDPMTVAFDIKYPWKDKTGYRNTFITIWHVDPETDRSDDSCGWFLRPRHLDKKVLDKIVKEFSFDWDGFFETEDKKYNCGLFLENGQPHFSVIGITINLFYKAALEVFRSRQKGSGYKYQKKAMRYIQRNLAEILFFAENPVDSLFNSITRKFEEGCKEEYTPQAREDRIRSMAGVVYSYIERDLRPWYKHPRWHIHHWKIQIHPLPKISRFLFDRCCICGKRFGYRESPIGNWEGNKIWHSKCDNEKKVPEQTKTVINANI